MAIVFIGQANATADAARIDVDLSAVPFEAGDLAIALVAYGNPGVALDAPPEGWVRLTGAPILEDVELEGEALVRFMGGMEETFSFRADDKSPIAAALAFWRGARGVDTLADVNEIAERAASPSTSHPTPGGTVRASGSLVVSLHFYWFNPLVVFADPATVTRSGAIIIGSPRPVAVGILDEILGPPIALARTSTTTIAGLANSLTVVITPATGERSPWDFRHGESQGLVEGAFELGHVEPGRIVSLDSGNRRRMFQSGEIVGDIIEVQIDVRPAAPPTGLVWRVALEIDGGEVAGLVIDRSRIVTLTANVAALAGDHEVAVALELAPE